MSDCLGDVAAALVDCELSHDARDRALAHITKCDPCRREVDAQRRLKALLANQADPEVSPDLTARLTAIAVGPNRPAHRDVVALRRRPRRSLKARAATYSALSVALVGGVVVAGGEHEGRKVRPPVTTYVQEHGATTGEMGPLHEPAGSVLLATYP